MIDITGLEQFLFETPPDELQRNQAHLQVRTDPQLPVDAPTCTTEENPLNL